MRVTTHRNAALARAVLYGHQPCAIVTIVTNERRSSFITIHLMSVILTYCKVVYCTR